MKSLNAEIAKFDPSKLDNDGYAILVAAYDTNGLGYVCGDHCRCPRNVKLGSSILILPTSRYR